MIEISYVNIMNERRTQYDYYKYKIVMMYKTYNYIYL